MKRKLLCGLLAAATLSLPAQAARTVPVQVDGEVLSAVSHLEAGVTYVPMRALLNAFGGWDIRWDSTAKAAVAMGGGRTIKADPAANTLSVGDMDYAGTVYVENGVTYVPLRLMATALGGGVVWDPYLDGAAVTSPGADHDAADLYWLSRIISAESRGEPLEGQIAVGNVVMNRTESSEFPDTIPTVVFDRKDAVQFEPVENGTVYLDPTEQSQEAARRVLEGETAVDGALYFYAPTLSKGVWINANRSYHTTIGCHRFYL